MDTKYLDFVEKNFGINARTSKKMVARILVANESSRAVNISQELDPALIEVKYRGTKGGEHEIAKILLMTLGTSINADDPLWKDM